MSISLYDALVPQFLQMLRALDGVLAKAEAFAVEHGAASAELVDARLAPNMLPLGYQVKSCAVHSIGAIEGVRRGEFNPDQSAWPTDLAGLRGLVRDATERLAAVEPGELDPLADASMRFAMGDFVLPFTGRDFLLSFSQPNFYFHAATAYGVLRARGVPIGKRDYLGAPRIAR